MFEMTSTFLLFCFLAVAVSMVYLLYPKRRPITTATANSAAEKPASSFKPYTQAEVAALGRFPAYETLTGVPLPSPYPSFDIQTAKPRPYRPFRWAYHQTMALTKMEPNWWLELESTYLNRLLQRQGLFEKYKTRIMDVIDDGDWRVKVACREVMEMVVQFICARYPQYFIFDREKMVLENRILGKSFDIEQMHPLTVIFENVPEDFAIVLPDEGKSGKYVFKAGIICSSLGWDLGDKIGKPIGEIHGGVPHYKEKMEMSMDRYFSKLTTDKPIQRGSWDIVPGEPLFEPADGSLVRSRQFQDPDLKEEDLNLRVDWQTLRRLPLSGGILFNYKAIFTPVTEFENEPGIPALVEKVFMEGNDRILAYKATWHVEHVVLPMLRRMKKKQAELGLWKEETEVRTLEETPFFRGWEAKWRRQQGF